MFRTSCTNFILISTVLVASVVSSLAASAENAQSSATANSKASNLLIEMNDYEQFVPYWTTEPGWRTELQMRNNLAKGDLTVTPVLRAHDGTEVPLSPVVIAPNEIKPLDVSEALSKSAVQPSASYGSIVFRYRAGGFRNLYAAAMVSEPGHPIMFHFDAFVEATDFDAGSREGIWWLPSASTKDYLVLTNNARQPLPIALSLYDAKGGSSRQRITLGPKTMARYSVRALIQKAGLTGNYGGFKIEAASKIGSLDTAYLLFDEIAGFSALMKTFDRNPQGEINQRPNSPPPTTWTTRAPMLALTNPDSALGFPSGTMLQPQIFLRNTTAAAVTVNSRFNWHTDAKSGSSSGPAVRLAPNETGRIDVAALQKSTVIPGEAHWASVEITIPGRPNDVMAVAASYDNTLKYGTQTPFNDQLTYRWEGGEWLVDTIHNSIITAGNGGNIPVKARVMLYYEGGKKRYDIEQSLKPHEQMWVDVGKLIREGVPDKNGLVLPADLTMGSYELQDLSDKGIGNLFEGKITLDKTYGHVAYGCATCCGYLDSAWMYYDPFGVGVGLQGYQDVWDRDNCTGLDESILEDVSSWNTGNHSIATANRNAITGVSIGSTTNSAQGNLTIGNIESKHCPDEDVYPEGTLNVPNLSCSPSTVTRGSSVSCTVTGPSGVAASGWQFQDTIGSSRVTSSSTSLTWSGTMVTSGTISVNANVSGASTPLSASITVNNRTNFAFTAVNPSELSGNSITCYDGQAVILASPPNGGSLGDLVQT